MKIPFMRRDGALIGPTGSEPRSRVARLVRWLLLVAILLVWCPYPLAADPPAPRPKAKNTKSKQKLLREGQRLEDVAGRFEPAGKRFAFVVENAPQRFLVLENLNLERIIKMSDVYPVPIRWKVSGLITEFKEENFLLIETATFSSLFRTGNPDAADGIEGGR